MLESGVTVRAARPDEAEALHALAALTFPLACPPSTTAAAKTEFIVEHLSAARFAAHLADASRVVLVAERTGAPAPERGDATSTGLMGALVGYAVLVHGEPSDPDVAIVVQRRPTAELSKLYVHPHQHGGGVAAALVDAAVAVTAARGAVSVWLGVNIHNARANRFYEKSGFAIIGRKGFLVGEIVEDDWVRERVLSI